MSDRFLTSSNAGALGWANGSYSFNATESMHQLVVDGVAGESITSSGWGASVGNVTYGGATYDVYKQGNAELLISHAMTANVL